jgi:anti-anti-sigma factor
MLDVPSATVYLAGEFDIDGVELFNGALRLVDSVGVPSLTIDMSQLTYLGSAGLGCLVGASRPKRGLVLTGVRAPQRRVLEMTGLDSVLRIVEAARPLADVIDLRDRAARPSERPIADQPARTASPPAG